MGWILVERGRLGAFPSKRWKGPPSFHRPQEGWPLGQNHRWKGRQGGPSSTFQWPQPLNAECPWHVTAGSGGPVRHLSSLPT